MRACLPNCLLLSGVFLMSTAAAQQLPRLDVEATCRAAPRLLAEDANPFDGCMRDERDAQRQLQEMWSGAAAAHRQACAEEAQIGGSPSYVDMLTCLQMAQGNTPAAEPRRRRTPN
jgi:hypothetical protein